MRPIFAIFNFLRGLKTTKFHEVPDGTATKMYGEDSNGDLIKDDVPSGGAAAFTELSDVPESYTDQAGKMLIVNENENGLEYIDLGTVITDSHTHTNKDVLDGIIDSGDGDEFLSDDGSYYAISGLPTGTNGQTLRNNSGTWEATSNFINTAGVGSLKALEIRDGSVSDYNDIILRAHKSSTSISYAKIVLEFGTNMSLSASSIGIKATRAASSYGYLGLTCYMGSTEGHHIDIQGAATEPIAVYPTFMCSGLAGTGNRPLYATSAGVITAGSLIALSGGSVVKMLTADDAIQSDTTLSKVSDFTQALLASSKYRITAKLTIHQVGGEADFKMQLAAPSGSTITGSYKKWIDGTNTEVVNNLYNDLTAEKNIEMDAYTDAAGYYYLEIEGIIETSTTAGNFTFSFAQLNSIAEITTLKKYSIIELTKI